MGKTILDALNELVEKQGGTTEDNKLIVDAINDLVNTSGGGSSSGVTEYFNIVKIVQDENGLKITECPESTNDGMPLLLLFDYGENGKTAINAMYESGYIKADTCYGVTGDNTISYYHEEYTLSNGLRVGSYLLPQDVNSFGYDITFTKEQGLG